jgi:hypothetical protein
MEDAEDYTAKEKSQLAIEQKKRIARDIVNHHHEILDEIDRLRATDRKPEEPEA